MTIQSCLTFSAREAELQFSKQALIAIPAVRRVVATPKPPRVVTEDVLVAGEWARRLAPPTCIDYLTRDGYTAYWLHLAERGQRRASGRATNDDTFEPRKALVR